MFEKWRRKETRLVEVPVNKSLPRADADIVASLRALPTNLGFAWLTSRLELAGRLLTSRLQNDRHETMREVDALQLGIQWCNWLQRELASVTSQPEKTQVALEEDIELLFKEIDAQYERISSQ